MRDKPDPIYVVTKTDFHEEDHWPIAYTASEQEAAALVAKLKEAERQRAGAGARECQFYISGPIYHVSDPNADKVAAGLVRAVPEEHFKGTPEEWVAALIKRGLWDGKNPPAMEDVWISEDDHREVESAAEMRWRDRDARYPALPSSLK